MMLGAIIWPILLINLGFTGIAFEVFIKRVHWIWLVLPLLWFGGYFAFALKDHLIVSALQGELKQHNTLIRIPFDPGLDALVMDNNKDASNLISDYRLPVVFTKLANSDANDFNAVRLADQSVCNVLRHNSFFQKAGIFTGSLGSRPKNGSYPTIDNRLCVIWLPEKPTGNVINVHRSSSDQTFQKLDIKRSSLIVRTPENGHYEILFGEAKPLVWWPKPLLFCALNSGGPSWECVSGFDRDSVVLAAQKSRKYFVVPDLLARALNLDFTMPEVRQATPNSKMIELIQSSLSRKGLQLDSSIFKGLETSRE